MRKNTFDIQDAILQRESAQDTLLALFERVESVDGYEDELSVEDYEKLQRLNTLLEQAFEFFQDFGNFDPDD